MEKLLKKISRVFLQQVMSRPLVLTRNVSLSYKILGESTFDPPQPPIFIFHGLLGYKKQWEAIGKTIRNITQRSVVTVDLRNHGDSPHDSSHKFTDQVKDILKLFEKLGASQASLIGPSMGGRTAMSLALMAPEKVSGLLVVDISPISTPPQYSDNLFQVMQIMNEINLRNYKTVEIAKTEVKKHLKHLIEDEYLLDTVLFNLKQSCNGEIIWACNLDVLIKDYKEWSSFPDSFRKKKFCGPTLFIGGQFSEYIPPDDLNNIRELFPQAVVIYIPKTNHNIHVEDPRTFLELTISFLRTNIYNDSTQPL